MAASAGRMWLSAPVIARGAAMNGRRRPPRGRHDLPLRAALTIVAMDRSSRETDGYGAVLPRVVDLLAATVAKTSSTPSATAASPNAFQPVTCRQNTLAAKEQMSRGALFELFSSSGRYDRKRCCAHRHVYAQCPANAAVRGESAPTSRPAGSAASSNIEDVYTRATCSVLGPLNIPGLLR